MRDEKKSGMFICSFRLKYIKIPKIKLRISAAESDVMLISQHNTNKTLSLRRYFICARLAKLRVSSSFALSWRPKDKTFHNRSEFTAMQLFAFFGRLFHSCFHRLLSFHSMAHSTSQAQAEAEAHSHFSSDIMAHFAELVPFIWVLCSVGRLQVLIITEINTGCRDSFAIYIIYAKRCR